MYTEVGPDPADLEAFREAAQDVRQILPNRSSTLLPGEDLRFYLLFIKTMFLLQDTEVLNLCHVSLLSF